MSTEKSKKGTVLILGAKSIIAKEISKIYAKNNYDLILSGRNISNDLKSFINYLKNKYDINISTLELDILNFSTHKHLYESLEIKPNGVISFIGLTDIQLSEKSTIIDNNIIRDTNFSGIASFIDVLLEDFKNKKNNWIMAVTSITADRGTKKNKVYASSKRNFNKYLETQRNKKGQQNIHITIVKLGLVNTAMIKRTNYPKFLVSEPDMVANSMFLAEQSKKKSVYIPSFWRLIMFILKLTPNPIYQKLF